MKQVPRDGAFEQGHRGCVSRTQPTVAYAPATSRAGWRYHGRTVGDLPPTAPNHTRARVSALGEMGLLVSPGDRRRTSGASPGPRVRRDVAPPSPARLVLVVVAFVAPWGDEGGLARASFPLEAEAIVECAPGVGTACRRRPAQEAALDVGFSVERARCREARACRKGRPTAARRRRRVTAPAGCRKSSRDRRIRAPTSKQRGAPLAPKDPLLANVETTMRPVVRCGSPIGASVALWREPGYPVSRDAVADRGACRVEGAEAGQQARPTPAPARKESSRAAQPDARFATPAAVPPGAADYRIAPAER